MSEPSLIWSVTEGSEGNGTSWAFDWGDGSGEASGDIALVFGYKESTSTVSEPSGWSLEDTWDVNIGGFEYRAAIYSHVLDGTETGAITFSWTGSTWRGALMIVVRNPLSSGFLLSPTEDVEAAQNDQPSHPGITVQRSNSGLLFVVFNFDNGYTSISGPAGFTALDSSPFDASGQITLFYDFTSIATGATGALAATFSGGAAAEYASSWVAELATEAGGGGTKAPILRRQPLRVWNRRIA